MALLRHPGARVGFSGRAGGLRDTYYHLRRAHVGSASERMDRDDRRLSERQLADDGRDADRDQAIDRRSGDPLFDL